MTSDQVLEKPDFSSPEYKERQREQQIQFHLHQLGCLLDQRKKRDEEIDSVSFDLANLQGQDCWCSLDEPCHADVLLEIANHD